MNKYLLMCAAAAMGAAVSGHVARASTTVRFGSSAGGSYCDYFVITRSGGGLYAAVHHGGVTCASTSVQYDAGVLDKKGKIPGDNGSVQFADTTLAKAEGFYAGLDFDLQSPFGIRTSKWALIAATNGVTAFVVDHGYQEPGTPKRGAKKSVLHDAIVALGLKR